MPTALIFGGSGQIARHLTTLLINKNYTVHSIIRNSAQSSSLTSLGAHPIVQSIDTSSVSELASTIRDCSPDVVIFSAGAGAAGGIDTLRHRTVDRDGAIKSFDATAEAGGTKRYIIVSAIDVRDRDSKPVPGWYDDNDKKSSDELWGAIPAYMNMKLAADRDLVTGNSRRGLEYTIVRPNNLSNDPGTGAVSAGRVHLVAPVSRQDVAEVIVACIEDERTVGFAFDVTPGDVPIKQAVAKVVQEKLDTFKGYY